MRLEVYLVEEGSSATGNTCGALGIRTTRIPGVSAREERDRQRNHPIIMLKTALVLRKRKIDMEMPEATL